MITLVWDVLVFEPIMAKTTIVYRIQINIDVHTFIKSCVIVLFDSIINPIIESV